MKEPKLAYNQRWVAWKYENNRGGKSFCKFKFHEYGNLTYKRSIGAFHYFESDKGKLITCLIEFKS